MCGITGYIGKDPALSFVMQGLQKLEYRGYDSAGVTLVDEKGLSTFKTKGRLSELEKLLEDKTCPQVCGIGHTRWATHGVPSQLNSHPHSNQKNTISLVHNGIIENYASLKETLLKKGYSFQSETDTEIVVNLLDDYYYNDTNDLFEALKKTLKGLEGSFALCVVSKEFPDQIYVAKKESPMILGKNETGSFCASDAPALLAYTKRILPLEDGQIAILKKGKIEAYDFEGNTVEQKWIEVPYDIEAAQKGGYDSFMLKEIHEQPTAIRETLRGILVNRKIVFKELDELDYEWKKVNRIYFVACGTAYHAGIFAALTLQRNIVIPTIHVPASEFRYGDPYLDENSLCIFVSQSGETADTMAAMKLAKQKNAKTIAVVNALGSSMTRIADATIYTCAGPEISVASTKAYTTQLTLLTCLNVYLSEKIADHLPEPSLISDLKKLPQLVSEMLKEDKIIESLSHLLDEKSDAYFIGRLLDYPTALEGALKLKEISYVHADAYYAGELKHGPIALIEKKTVVIAVASQSEVAQKTISNIEETIARGAEVILITKKETEADKFRHVIRLPDMNDVLYPIVSIVLLQLLAYYTAVNKKCDIDKPRNLAKSVTVE